jgi:alkanesulfonate monooxygenase SsuD/methylene tetrahydromethanopterin reductase-like flavin-dependent oxidoreductase (luciferase family)
VTEAPFAPGSVSLGLTPVGGTVAQIVPRLVEDAAAAVEAGFDGVTLSEHHGGLPHYLSSPMAVAAGLLARLPRGWAAAAPSILPLRPPAIVAEDLAWQAALYPGRVAAGFVAGYHERDFDLVGADFNGRRAAFWAGLEHLADAFRGVSRLESDTAVAAARGLPVLAGVGGPLGVRRGARLGVGLLLTSLRRPAEVAPLIDAYRAAGGPGAVVLIRRVHVGPGSTSGLDAGLANWRSGADASASWLSADRDALVCGPTEAVAQQLAEALAVSGADALNLRIDAYPTRPDLVPRQVAELGAMVLPLLRDAIGE